MLRSAFDSVEYYAVVVVHDDVDATTAAAVVVAFFFSHLPYLSVRARQRQLWVKERDEEKQEIKLQQNHPKRNKINKAEPENVMLVDIHVRVYLAPFFFLYRCSMAKLNWKDDGIVAERDR